MKSPWFIVHSSKCSTSRSTPRTPSSELRTPNSGFTYIALLAAIVILGILMGAAGKYWRNVMLREKEEELLFRGEQYVLAIERYYRAVPGKNAYPRNIDDLLKDNRTAKGKRHLRQLFKDPITGEDFEIITAQSTTAAIAGAAAQQTAMAGIIGVHSKSDKEPLKQAGFPDRMPFKDFEGKKKYSDWTFIFTQMTTTETGTLERRRTPGR